MASNLSYVILDSGITVYIDGNQYFINSNEFPYLELKNILLSDIETKYDSVKEVLNKLFNTIKSICEDVYVKNSIIYIDKIPVNNSIGKLLTEMSDSGSDLNPFINFIRNVRKNPNNKIINEICDFIEKSYEDGGFTITPEGNILAYKKVSEDFMDIHSKMFYNGPGSIVEMNRNDVCSDRSVTCAPGLHFCSFSYLSNFGSGNDNKIMILEINPKDIVSIPIDYANAKGRCCKYKVIGELGKDTNRSVIKTPVYTENNKYENDEKAILFNEILKDINNKEDKTSDHVYCFILDFVNLYTGRQILELLSDYDNKYNKKFIRFSFPEKLKISKDNFVYNYIKNINSVFSKDPTHKESVEMLKTLSSILKYDINYKVII